MNSENPIKLWCLIKLFRSELSVAKILENITRETDDMRIKGREKKKGCEGK